MRALYKLAIGSYQVLLHGLSPVNEKAKKWVDGRKGLNRQLENIKVTHPLIWFHCASLGEFEQGKPVMEAFKKRHPSWLLLVTFYSPSGYEAQKNFALADYIFYLPEETKSNINLFINVLKPRIAVFVKYEFWYGYMAELENRKIPLVFISSSFRKEQLFFKIYGSWFLKQLKSVQMFFVQDEKSKSLLEKNGIERVEVSGDTRFDRVFETKNDNEEIPIIREFKGDSKVLVFGSAWKIETEYLNAIISKIPEDWKIIYAPHEINHILIEELRKGWRVDSVRISEIESGSVPEAKVLVLDTIGQLARSYRYANIAFVGGGFIDGIHNILEPLAFGAPVFFGPNHRKFWEASEAINCGVGFEVSEYTQFENQVFLLMENPNKLTVISSKSKKFIEDRVGATKVVSNFLNKIGQIISCQI